MVYLPELKQVASPLQKQIIDFRGYSMAPVIDDGEMREMLNLSSDEYPNLSQRKMRGNYTIQGQSVGYPSPETMLVVNGKLAVISNNGEQARFYYGHDEDLQPQDYPGVTLSPANNNHQMVAINKKIVIYPEKVWFDVDTHESGSIDYEMVWEPGGTGEYSGNIVFENDTTTECTVTFGSDASTDALAGISVQDAIDIDIVDASDNAFSFTSTIKAVSGNVLTVPADTFLTFLGDDSTKTLSAGSVTLKRQSPDLDYVMESNNRLWGCKGNTIYACKLGDPTNWNYFQMLTVDSYAVDVGTDGIFTGCCAYSTHLMFFKENYIHKLYGNRPNEYTIQTAQCYGLEAGSEKSICIINDTVFYKSKLGIMAYTGSLPEHISANFGSKSYYNAIAGTDGLKYYVSMKTTDGTRDFLVFDLDKKLWHKESDPDPVMFAFMTNDAGNESLRTSGEYRNMLLYLSEGYDDEGNVTPSHRRIRSIDPYVPDEGKIEWMAVLGSFDEYMEQKKIYSKIRMRLRLEEGSELTISIRHDQGEWQEMRHIYADDAQMVFVPVSPIRCNKFYIKLEGKGRCIVESLQRDYRERSDR